MTNQKSLDKGKGIKEIELGRTFWLGISFTAGCFGFGWIPFIIVVVCFLIIWKKL